MWENRTKIHKFFDRFELDEFDWMTTLHTLEVYKSFF